MSPRVRYANQAHKILVTDGHEAEAKAAQLRKRPSRMGLVLLRVLGFRGDIAQPLPAQDTKAHPMSTPCPTNIRQVTLMTTCIADAPY